jgi:4-azaleucine resistance transporter AzlC
VTGGPTKASWPVFLIGLKAALPVMVGYLPVALAFGLVSPQGGLSLSSAVLMSAMVYAGASQFMAVSMLSLGAPLPEIILATLFINLRHVVMNLALLPRLPIRSVVLRAVVAAGVTDETFALASFSTDPALRTPAGMLGLVSSCWATWWLGTLLGRWVAPLIPKLLNDVMGVTLYGVFIGLLVPAVRRAPRGLFVAVVAMAIHVAARQAMPVGWALVSAIVGGSLAGGVLGGPVDKIDVA